MKALATYTSRDIDELVSYVETAELAAMSERAAFGFTSSPYEDEDGYEDVWDAAIAERLAFHSGIIS